MAYGIATYDANGIYNNYGIRPVTVVGNIELANGQVSGSYSFNIPSGTKVGFVVFAQSDSLISYTDKRLIEASGNTITVSATTGYGNGVTSTGASNVIVFLENA